MHFIQNIIFTFGGEIIRVLYRTYETLYLVYLIYICTLHTSSKSRVKTTMSIVTQMYKN